MRTKTVPSVRTVEAQDDLLAHPAVQAWQRLHPRFAPSRVEVLKERETESRAGVFRLSGLGPGDAPVVAKRCSKAIAAVERSVYERILPRMPVRAPRFHGSLDEGDLAWLFLEDIGDARYSPREADHRVLAAKWLGLVHLCAAELADEVPLPDAGPLRYLEHLRSARATVNAHVANPAFGSEGVASLRMVLRHLDRIESIWDAIEASCAGIPRTLVHGDFGPKNVRVDGGAGRQSVLPIDWEKAGWGLPLADLAQPSLPLTKFLPRPDLATYAAVVHERLPGLDARALERLGRCGTVFRCLSTMDWVSTGLGSRSFEQSLATMRLYMAEQEEAMRAEGWA